jgi:hypothetical protein
MISTGRTELRWYPDAARCMFTLSYGPTVNATTSFAAPPTCAKEICYGRIRTFGPTWDENKEMAGAGS